MKPRKGSLTDLERLDAGRPGKVRRFMARILKGREHIRGAKAQAVADAAGEFHKEPRTIERYIKEAAPLQEFEIAWNDLNKKHEAAWAEAASAMIESTTEPLEMLALIKQHFSDEQREKFAHLEVIDQYNIALAIAQKIKSVHDRK
jgi:hypothetical protein